MLLFYWGDIFDTFFKYTAPITLILFFVKYYIDKREENKKKKKEHDNNFYYFNTLLEKIISSAETQIENYDVYAKRINDEPVNNHQLTIINIENLNRVVSKIEQQKIFHSFVIQFKPELQKKATDNFLEIYNQLDVYLLLFNSVVTINTKLIQKITLLDSEYIKLSTDRILPKIKSLSDELSKSNSPINLVFQQILNKYNTIEKPNVFQMQNSLINVLMKNKNICADKIFDSLIYDCNLLTSIYESIERSSKFQAKEVVIIRDQLRKLVDKVNILIDENKDLLKK